MNGILLINKEKGITSRDVVNQVSKKLKIKKVGHAGTLDPLAEGLMVIGVENGTKVLDLLTQDFKEYIATVKMGIETDTLDITGKIINQNKDIKVTKEEIKQVLNSFKGSYNQIVPKYSAVKINGKKLYEYARNNIEIELPKRLVSIYEIELLNVDLKNQEFTFKTLVSKGTYIRSLIKDIGISLNIYCTMEKLIRTKSGKFTIDDSFLIDDEFKFISIKDALDLKTIIIQDANLLKKIKNGNKINLDYQDEYILLLDSNNQELAIYKNDLDCYKAFKMFS